MLTFVQVLYFFITTTLVMAGQRKSRGHIIIIGGGGGSGHRTEQKIVPVPIPYPMPCPLPHSPLPQPRPIIVRVPVPAIHYPVHHQPIYQPVHQPVHQSVHQPVHQPIPIVRYVPQVQHQIPMLQKVPVFVKESEINLKENPYPMHHMNSYDTNAQHSDYDKNELMGHQTQEGAHEQESRLNFISSRLRIKAVKQ